MYKSVDEQLRELEKTIRETARANRNEIIRQKIRTLIHEFDDGHPAVAHLTQAIAAVGE